MNTRRVALLALIALLPAVASAAVLYKSVDANGVVMFSDTPPAGNARILEERSIPVPGGDPSTPALVAVPAEQRLNAEPLLDTDPAVAGANAQLDQAERALALARRAIWSHHDGMRLVATRLSLADEERLEPYKKNVKIARLYLMELLRERRLVKPGTDPKPSNAENRGLSPGRA